MKKPKFPISNTSQIIISLTVALLLLLVIRYSFIMNPEISVKPIKLAIGEWAPYTGEDLVDYGIVSALVTKIFKEMGYAPEYQFMSWPMAESIAGTGEKDSDIQGTFPYSENSRRKNIFYFSDTLISLEFAFFYHTEKNPKGRYLVQTEDLKNHVILSIDGYDYPKDLYMYYDTLNVYANNISAFQELSIRTDNALVIEAKEVGEQLLEQKLPHLAKYVRQAPLKLNLHLKLMLSRSNPNNLSVIKDFNKKLMAFKSNHDVFISLFNNVKNKIDLQRAVILQPYKEDGVIYCYRDKNINNYALLPKGTKAIIKEWDPSFLKFQSPDAGDHITYVKVKLLNGPLSLFDSLYYVDGRSIQISNN